MMKRHPSNRRISAVAITRGSTRRLMGAPDPSAAGANALRRCNTTTTATVTPKTNHNSVPSSLVDSDDRAHAVRGWIVGFLGRKLSLEEDALLQEDCTKFVQAAESDHDAVKRVLQTLLAAYFMQAADRDDEDEIAGRKTRTSSIHLEAEAGIVETMAVQKIQACARGLLERRRHFVAIQVAKQRAQKVIEQQQIERQKLKLESETKIRANSRISDLTRTDSQDLQEAVIAAEGELEVSAAVLIQSMIRGHVTRQQSEYWQAKQIQKISLPTSTKPETERKSATEKRKVSIKVEETTTTTTPPTQPTTSIDITPSSKARASVKGSRASVSLAAITETAPVTFPSEDNAQDDTTTAKPAAAATTPTTATTTEANNKLQDSGSNLMEDSSRTTNARGMRLLSESSDELSSVTDMVKINIVIKVQALIRSYLVRRRRRRLRKARSIRMLKSRPSLIMTITKGTPLEHAAATDIQRTVRGYVQRWKYWTAMRQQQLDEINHLKAKQLRKIEERKKIMLKTTKKQLFFDATSLARQLQRAKRAIKFLVKEEKRAIQQNDRLSAECFELKKANQWLANSTETATHSNQTLEAEIKGLQARKDRLSGMKKERQSTVKQLTLEWKQASKDSQREKQRKEEIQACLARIKERAADFFQDHPNLEEEILASVKAEIKASNSNSAQQQPKPSNGVHHAS